MIRTTRLFFVALLCSLLIFVVNAAGDEPKSPVSKTDADRNGQKIPTKIAGTYKGGELVELRVRDRIAYLVKPTGVVDAQKRWVWEFPFWLGINDGFGNLAHRYYVEKALAAGFHVAGVDVGPSFGSSAAAEVCQEFHEQLVSKYGLNKRARLLAHSHGGLIAYGWAFRHPACVDRIAGMCPATDFRSYPTLANVVSLPAKALGYGLSLEELDRRAAEFNPIDNLAPLAKAGAKILHVHGDEDKVIPTNANSTELARRYRDLGGVAEVVVLKGLPAAKRGHDGPELYESAPLLKFLLADEPTSIPSATTAQIQQTVERSIGYLQAESAAWLKTRGCAACHHLPMPLWALSEADRQGYAIDKKYLADTFESLLGSKEKLMSSRIFPNPADPPDPRPQGRGLNMGLPFLAVAARSLPSLKEGQKQSLKLIAEEIVKKQQPDGSWEFFATLRRPPINENKTTDAAWIIMALEGEMGPDAPESQRVALKKAIAWLDAAKLSGIHQDKALKVLLASRAGKPRDKMQTTIDELLALQRADGGWSQTVPELKSDAFATGQTLYVLSLVGYTAERPEIKRAIDFLVATQKPDGSWPMISRSTPDGSPGSSKLLTPITCAASSWATLGLARLSPKRR